LEIAPVWPLEKPQMQWKKNYCGGYQRPILKGRIIGLFCMADMFARHASQIVEIAPYHNIVYLRISNLPRNPAFKVGADTALFGIVFHPKAGQLCASEHQALSRFFGINWMYHQYSGRKNLPHNWLADIARYRSVLPFA
jgi:hypothetical protein